MYTALFALVLHTQLSCCFKSIDSTEVHVHMSVFVLVFEFSRECLFHHAQAQSNGCTFGAWFVPLQVEQRHF
jgi:hypothetical protein